MIKVIIFTRLAITGGKAGKGYNKTASIQVCERMKGGYRIIKIFRYKIKDPKSKLGASDKAAIYEMQIKEKVCELNKLMGY